jgi:uronate dehydrogenase
MTQACDDVVGIVHLAATASEDDFLSVLLPRNVVGTWSIFEAAVRSGVRHFVFASTAQTVQAYPPGTALTPSMPSRPMSIYACTKLFGEAIAQYHADRHDVSVACLRIGWVVPSDSPLFRTSRSLPRLWCGPEDLAALILAALESDVGFATVFAVSTPATNRFDVSNPYGWQPIQTPKLRLRRTARLRRLQGLLGRFRRQHGESRVPGPVGTGRQ